MRATVQPKSCQPAAPETDQNHDPPSTATVTATFKHTPLDKKRKAFRLFRLVHTSSDGINIEIENFLIEEAPRYHAISYCWGVQRSMPTVNLNGRPFQIGQNLHDLLAVRKEKLDGLYLWADQICIDQNVTTERNQQVSQMDDVYSKADAVLVWLGLHETASAAVSELNRVYTELGGRAEALKSGKSHLNNGVKHQTLPGTTPDAIECLLLNPYWRRHWIIQEILLAQRIYILYDRHEVFWEMFKLLVTGCSYSVPRDNRFIEKHLWTLMDLPTTFDDEVQPITCEFLQLCNVSLCSDPRDKVYGLQSLLREEMRVEVDYSKEAREVFLDAAIKYLVEEPPENRHYLWISLQWLAISMGIGEISGDFVAKAACIDQVRDLLGLIMTDPSKEGSLMGAIRDLVAEALLK